MDDSLSYKSFLTRAQKAAHRAMEDHGRGEYDEFALHAGVAVEQLAKAVLVSKNPVYLLDLNKGNPDLLLYFGGHLEMDVEKVRTVGAADAIKRLRKLGTLPPGPRLDKLIDLRNGTAHAGGGDGAKTLLPAFAESTALLLMEIAVPVAGFWGRWSSMVNFAVDKQRTEVERDVQIRIRQARHLFEDRFSGLPRDVKERALNNPSPNATPTGIDRFGSPVDGTTYRLLATTLCPACGGEATVALQPTEREKGTTVSMESFHCVLCSLSLEGSAEVEAANVEHPMHSGRPLRTITVTGYRAQLRAEQ
ncbi:hypothetical protein [Streptomyces sp. NPDC047130]|uniref:hypothetical protein n=1 Tax=Streptomyces sp. NPDC047130 TaxID=3155261 RepID=UPI0033EEE2FF